MGSQEILSRGKQVRSNSRVPKDPSEADLMLERRAYLVAQVAEAQAQYDRAKAKLDDALDKATYSAKAELDRIDERLAQFIKRHVAAGGEARLKLIHGKLVLNPPGKGRSKIINHEELVTWCEENCPEAVKPLGLPDIDIEKLRGRFDMPEHVEPNTKAKLYDRATGEEIPGFVIEVGERTWKVEQ